MLAQRLVPQSSKLITRVRFPYTARYDSMPVGRSRRDVMTMRFVSDDPRLRLFDGHADYRRRPSFQDDANSPRRRGRRESDQPIRPVRKRFPETWVTAFLVSRPTGCGNGLEEHGSSAPVIPVMPHAVVCASTASMSARIRHEWPDRLWTVRILRPRKGGIRTCFRSPTGRGNSLRNCPVRVRTPAKAPAEATASTPPDPVRTSDGTGTMLR